MTVWLVEEFGRGGIARYAADVADLLHPEVETVVATTSYGPADGLRAPHAVWFPTGRGGAGGKALAAALALLRLPARVSRGDVVWIPLGVRPAFEAALAVAVRLRGAHLVATLHNRAPHHRRRASRGVLVAARLAHRVVVHGEALADWAHERRLDVALLPFPPPREGGGCPAGRHDRESLGARDGDVLVALVGNLSPYKGVDVLLDAAAIALDRRDAPPLRLVLAGQPADGADVAAEVARRGLARRTTLLLDYLPGGELLDVVDAADVVALCYRRIDHTGVGALVAARGKPALASDLAPLRELFGPAALYVPAGQVQPLADALVRLPGALTRLPRPEVQQRGLAATYRAFVRTLDPPRSGPTP